MKSNVKIVIEKDDTGNDKFALLKFKGMVRDVLSNNIIIDFELYNVCHYYRKKTSGEYGHSVRQASMTVSTEFDVLNNKTELEVRHFVENKFAELYNIAKRGLYSTDYLKLVISNDIYFKDIKAVSIDSLVKDHYNTSIDDYLGRKATEDDYIEHMMIINPYAN